MLPHLPEGFTAVVAGANGGIGSAILQSLLSSPQSSWMKYHLPGDAY